MYIDIYIYIYMCVYIYRGRCSYFNFIYLYLFIYLYFYCLTLINKIYFTYFLYFIKNDNFISDSINYRLIQLNSFEVIHLIALEKEAINFNAMINL
jgi:hypothetical protein